MNGKTKILTSMAIFGTVGIFVRFIPMASAGIAFCRGVMGCLFLLIFMAATGKKPNLQQIKANGWRLAISGAAIGINWILLFEAYKYTTVSVATLSYYFAPVIVTLVCPVLFKEKLTGKQIVCFVMSTVGLVLIKKWRLFTRDEDIAEIERDTEARRNVARLRGPIDVKFVIRQIAGRALAAFRKG